MGPVGVTCTWQGCDSPGVRIWHDRSGAPWANLCEPHDAQLTYSVGGDAKAFVRAWVAAMGGPQHAVATHFRAAVAAGDRLLQALGPRTAVARLGTSKLFERILEKLERGGS